MVVRGGRGKEGPQDFIMSALENGQSVRKMQTELMRSVGQGGIFNFKHVFVCSNGATSNQNILYVAEDADLKLGEKIKARNEFFRSTVSRHNVEGLQEQHRGLRWVHVHWLERGRNATEGIV